MCSASRRQAKVVSESKHYTNIDFPKLKPQTNDLLAEDERKLHLSQTLHLWRHLSKLKLQIYVYQEIDLHMLVTITCY